MKTDEEIAREIACKLGGFREAYDAAMEMAKIKGEQIKSVLRALSGDTGDENDLWYKMPLDGSVPFS